MNAFTNSTSFSLSRKKIIFFLLPFFLLLPFLSTLNIFFLLQKKWISFICASGVMVMYGGIIIMILLNYWALAKSPALVVDEKGILLHPFPSFYFLEDPLFIGWETVQKVYAEKHSLTLSYKKGSGSHSLAIKNYYNVPLTVVHQLIEERLTTFIDQNT